MSDRSDITGSLRILHIGKYFPPHPGGMETYLRDLMNVQKRQGLEVMALVHASERGLFDMEESVDALDGTTYQVMRSARWFNLSFVPISPGFIWSAFKAIKNFKPDLIHIHHPNSSAMWLLLLPAARRLPWVAHWHSDIETPSSSTFVKFLYRIYRPFEQAILRKTARIITTSPPYLEASAALTSQNRKCEVIPLGLDPARLPQTEEVTTVSRPNEPLVLFIGRLAPYKGLLNLIEAIAELREVHCWVAGDGKLKRKLQSTIQQRKLTDRVALLGPVTEEEKWRLFKSCDVLALPSIEKTEAFGMVLLEAAHFAKPVVVTDAAGSGMAWVASQIPGSRVAKTSASSNLAKAITESLKAAASKSELELPKSSNPFDLAEQAYQIKRQYQIALTSPADPVSPNS